MTQRSQRWFVARLLSERTFPGDRSAEPLYEDTLVLLQASDEAEAQQRARAHGVAEQHEYANDLGELVRWEFREILDVQEVLDDEVADGTELYYRFLGPRELEDVRRVLNARVEEPTSV